MFHYCVVCYVALLKLILINISIDCDWSFITFRRRQTSTRWKASNTLREFIYGGQIFRILYLIYLKNLRGSHPHPRTLSNTNASRLTNSLPCKTLLLSYQQKEFYLWRGWNSESPCSFYPALLSFSLCSAFLFCSLLGKYREFIVLALSLRHGSNPWNVSSLSTLTHTHTFGNIGWCMYLTFPVIYLGLLTTVSSVGI